MSQDSLMVCAFVHQMSRTVHGVVWIENKRHWNFEIQFSKIATYQGKNTSICSRWEFYHEIFVLDVITLIRLNQNREYTLENILPIVNCRRSNKRKVLSLANFHPRHSSYIMHYSSFFQSLICKYRKYIWKPVARKQM